MSPSREFDVEERIADILDKFVGKKFHEITISNVRRQYEVARRYADIVVLIEGGAPLLIIETKKKYEVRGFRAVSRFMVTSPEVLGQVVSYAAILKRNGIYVPFIATANDKQIALFLTPDDVNVIVDWDAVHSRSYDEVLSRDQVYRLREEYLIFHKSIRFSEEFFGELLDTITGIYVKKYGLKDKRQELHYTLIEDLRGFVDFLAPFCA